MKICFNKLQEILDFSDPCNLSQMANALFACKQNICHGGINIWSLNFRIAPKSKLSVSLRL